MPILTPEELAALNDAHLELERSAEQHSLALQAAETAPHTHLQVVVHFFETDPDCRADYASVDVRLNGVKLVEYGNAYHDQGLARAQGFVDAICVLRGQARCTVDTTRIADYI